MRNGTMKLFLFFLLFLKIITPTSACGDSDDVGCLDVLPCFAYGETCTECTSDDNCSGDEQCLLETELGFCTDDNGAMTCHEDCDACNFRGSAFRCLCFIFEGETPVCPNGGTCGVGDTGYGDACLAPFRPTESPTSVPTTAPTTGAPTTSPSSSPSTSPSSSPSTSPSSPTMAPTVMTGGGANCFSEKSTCLERSRGNILVKDLDVGDKVLTASGQFKTVYTIDHKDPSQKANFIQIHYTFYNNSNTSADNNSNQSFVLELTPSHMVFLNGLKDPVAASHLDIGDTIQIKPFPHSHHGQDELSGGTISKILNVSRVGIWNPLTTDGTIVVDGVVTSTYSILFGDYQTNSKDESSALRLGSVKLSSHHKFAHRLMAPYRALCMIGILSPSASVPILSLMEQRGVYYYGYNIYSYIGKNILNVALKQHVIIQGFILFAAFVLIHAFAVLLSPLGVAGAVMSVLYCIFCQSRAAK